MRDSPVERLQVRSVNKRRQRLELVPSLSTLEKKMATKKATKKTTKKVAAKKKTTKKAAKKK